MGGFPVGRKAARALAGLIALSGGAGLVLASAVPPSLASGGAQTPQSFAKAEVGYYAQNLPARLQAPPAGVDYQCLAPAGNPAPDANSQGVPTSPAWRQRDTENQYCATLRLRDQYTNPSYGYANAVSGDQLWIDQAFQQISDGPGHIHGGLSTLVPGSQAADAFRTISRWESLTGGSVQEVNFKAADGAQLRGHLWLPNPTKDSKPAGGYPGVVITDGSVQGYENLYYWAAEGLAQYGYEVLTYDVQGQGDSDLLPGSCTPSSCPGVPYQQNYNFYQGAEDSLNWFDSASNPGYGDLDTGEIAVAGHSLGAAGVSWAGQCDSRVKTIVAWDDLSAIAPGQCRQNVVVPARFQNPAAYQHGTVSRPALALTNDYLFNPQPQTSVPDPNAKDAGYQQLVKAGLDSEIVAFRGATHLTYSYVPYLLPASELAERFAFYYTLAWLDDYLRGGQDPYTGNAAFSRLTSLSSYDPSPDRNSAGTVSIGAGTYSPAGAAADPANPEAGNVPYRIDGISIPDSLSFYYYSEFSLHNPATGTQQTCADMRAGCPASQPPTP
jgi:hypothetical protein